MNTCQLSLHNATFFFFAVLRSSALWEMSSPWTTWHPPPPQSPRGIDPIQTHKNMNPLLKNKTKNTFIFIVPLFNLILAGILFFIQFFVFLKSFLLFWKSDFLLNQQFPFSFCTLISSLICNFSCLNYFVGPVQLSCLTEIKSLTMSQTQLYQLCSIRFISFFS